MTDTDRLTRIEREQADLALRMRGLELAQVKHESDREHFDRRFDNLEKSQDKLQSYLSRAVWLILIAILGGLMNFIIDGGLNVTPSP